MAEIINKTALWIHSEFSDLKTRISFADSVIIVKENEPSTVVLPEYLTLHYIFLCWLSFILIRALHSCLHFLWKKLGLKGLSNICKTKGSVLTWHISNS